MSNSSRLLAALATLLLLTGCTTTTFVPKNADNALTTVVLVRHAEKALDQGKDPELTEDGRKRAEKLAWMLADLQPDAIFATQYQRTELTVAPLSMQSGIAITRMSAANIDGLAQRIREEHVGGTVVVSAHSNTVPAIIAALGSEPVPDIADSDYSNLYIVSLPALGPGRTVRLHFSY